MAGDWAVDDKGDAPRAHNDIVVIRAISGRFCVCDHYGL
jgi:hypothetical protein